MRNNSATEFLRLDHGNAGVQMRRFIQAAAIFFTKGKENCDDGVTNAALFLPPAPESLINLNQT